MRLVLDTNVVVSGLLWGGGPTQLLNAAQIGEIELFTSRALLAELSNILTRSKFAKVISATALSRNELVLGYAELATVIVPTQIALTIVADPSDGIGHLHGLGSKYQGMKIVTPAQAVELIGA